MLAILLTAIKIVGIVLLCVLCFLLLAILLILFVPVRYRAKASYDKIPLAHTTASWLFHLVSFRADYEESLTWSLRVLGINIFRQKPKEEWEEKESVIPLREEESPSADADLKEYEEETKTESHAEVKKEAKQEAEAEYEEQAAFEEVNESADRPEQVTGPDEKETAERLEEARALREWDKVEEAGEELREESPLRKIRAPVQEFIRKIRDFFTRLWDLMKDRFRYLRVELWEAAIEKKDWLVWLLRDPANVATYHLLWKQLKKLLNHIRPRKLEGDVKFGSEDPYLTGQILVAISPFYPLYGRNITVTPVFGENVAEGKISLKGRVRLFVVLEVVIRMLLDKNFRYLLNRFMDS